LEDFTLEQIAELNHRCKSPLRTTREVEILHDFVGGHPYLVRLALYAVAAHGCSIDELCASAVRGAGPMIGPLHYFHRLVMSHPNLESAVREVMSTCICRDETTFQLLWSAGLVSAGHRKNVTLRCKLFHDYFMANL